jgi:hypothetical protein
MYSTVLYGTGLVTLTSLLPVGFQSHLSPRPVTSPHHQSTSCSWRHLKLPYSSSLSPDISPLSIHGEHLNATFIPPKHCDKMSTDNESAPLMDGVEDRHEDSHNAHEDEESTPLLLNTDTPRYDGEERVTSPAASSLRSIQSNQTSSSRRSSKGTSWATQVAVTALATLFLVIVFGFFFAPAAVEEYAKESLVIEPTGVSIDSITSNGVKARIQAKFRMDASRVKNDHVRNIGRAGTWLAHKVETEESRVSVYLPEYDNVLIGTAVVPKVIVSIRNGETTDIDFLCDLVPGDTGDIRRVINDWLEGRLGQLRVRGSADIALRSGIIPLGIQTISESLVLEGQSLYKAYASFLFGEKFLA